MCGTGESDQNDIVANFAHFREHVEAVAGTVAHAIQVEDDCVQFSALEGSLDLQFRRGQQSAKFVSQMLAKFRKESGIVGNQGKSESFGAGGRCGQSSTPSEGEIIGETKGKRKRELCAG